MNSPTITVENIHEKNSQLLLQEVAPSLSSMSDEDGQTLLAGIFGSGIKSDCHGLLSHIRSQMRVSSLGRQDVELLENGQSLFAPNQHALVQRIVMASIRLSGNLLPEDATDVFLSCLIEWQQREPLVSFLSSRLPSVHARAIKILGNAVRIGAADFLGILMPSRIDFSPLKGVRGGRLLVWLPTSTVAPGSRPESAFKNLIFVNFSNHHYI